ncbi:MAG: hypothetical protein Q7T33_06445, partial [Dehalococcoidia bacterium]|nr:hypothetical protein [Dehalococcoidia bacterium]
MNKQSIETAEAEAKRFLARVSDLRDIISENAQECLRRTRNDNKAFTGDLPHNWDTDRPVIASGALRRASMDLTRALAKMRR